MKMDFLFFYLIFVSLVSGTLFYYDKILAKKSKRRIAELLLHIVELMGGVFINLILMFLIKHKNKKLNYKFVTFLIFILWLFLFFDLLIN